MVTKKGDVKNKIFFYLIPGKQVPHVDMTY